MKSTSALDVKSTLGGTEIKNSGSDIVRFFAQFIERELGIVYSDSNYFQLNSRLQDIAKQKKLASVDELHRMAQASMTSDLKQLILDVATNNETSFFRDTKLFDAVRDHLIPEVFKTEKPIRIWSAACSTGQEPYSLAMLLREHRSNTNSMRDFSILATDISSRALDKAKAARYSKFEVERGVTPSLLSKYFDQNGDEGWTVRSNIRSLVGFDHVNLLDSFERLGRFDVIFCRNVLIYQSVENKRLILRKIADRMENGAYLLLGAGESMIGLSNDFTAVNHGGTIMYQLKKR